MASKSLSPSPNPSSESGSNPSSGSRSRSSSMSGPYRASEIRIDDLYNYEWILTGVDREYDGKIIVYVVYEKDSSFTSNYLFYVHIEEERPCWQLVMREAIFACYSIICHGGDFREIRFPGIRITRRPEWLRRLH
ncbi:hypothetical protein SPOG_01849 [Schizosaccharomyces cryophilus OY26]|uniref:Uncharacterized protein n=1 Tax=Schizosaccharomyces cryophilus (strain OY26 / ATCC MYA-4695 / CBS 11777 / NBRC 106824 / NRRL Y48691) TaxID=653667 RepID=S9W3J8_SCHCR|nr:uncharacterized protein SPOG_01849 [Schizosaccharomyces cryophilus OY26]EPY52525.1 hypothetical protein SPOG_01849 [Schizosaccharomyces cryophilus OY26]